MGEAIETTQKLYPSLLEHDPNLLFMLKCRQFIEMVNGTDSEVRPIRSPKPPSSNSPCMSPSYNVHCPGHSYQSSSSRSNSPSLIYQPPLITPKSISNGHSSNTESCGLNVGEMNAVNLVINGDSPKVLGGSSKTTVVGASHDNDVDMETTDSDESSRNAVTNGSTTNGYQNGDHDSGGDTEEEEDDMGKL